MLVVMALEIESQGLFAERGVPVLYTGLGKVNAAYRLARALSEHRTRFGALPRVVNFGTAGSPTLRAGSVVACRRFVQRDMDVSGLGFPVGTTPFEEVPALLEFPVMFPELAEGLCGTGDRFETEFIGQGMINRSAEDTLMLAWDLLAAMPADTLKRIPQKFIAQYHVSRAA